MKRIKLTRQEREIENALLRGEYVKVSKAEFDEIAQAIARRQLIINPSRPCAGFSKG